MPPQAARPPPTGSTFPSDYPTNSHVQERALWLLACLAGVIFLIAGLRPHLAPSDPTPATPDDPVTTAPVGVAVLNGCGDPQVAARMTRRARALGLDVIHEGNAASFAYVQSVVIDRTGNMQAGADVARILGIRHYVQQVSDDPYMLEEATIVIGKDYKRLNLLEP